MAERLDIDLSGKATAATADAQAELKRTLAKRMGFAVVLIAVLLAALAVFDRLSQPVQTDGLEAPAARPPVPLARQEVAKPLTPAAPLETASATATGETAPAAIEKSSSALPPAPPKPEVQAQPTAPAAPAAAAKPDSRPAVAESSAAALAVPPPVAAPHMPRPPAAAPAAAPTAAPATATPTVVVPRLLSGYVLQAGVFTSAQRAEELYAKLQLNGIPSTMEARVHVGPFKSRAEADAVRDKLKGLGVDAVLIPPKGVRH